MRKPLRALCAAAALAAVSPVVAQTYTWTGAGSGPDWNVPGNWLGGVAPVSGLDTAIIFPFTNFTATNQNIATPFVLNSLTFNGSNYNLTGNSLEFRTNTAGVEPVLFNFNFNSSLANPLVFTNTLNYTVQQTGINFLMSGGASGPGGLTVRSLYPNGFDSQNANGLRVTAATSYSGPTTVNGALLTLEGAGTVAASSSISVNRFGTLRLDNFSTNANRIGDAATVNLGGGEIRIRPNSSGSSETFGTLMLQTGASAIYDNQSGNPVTLTTANALSRSPGATLFVGLNGLGSTSTVAFGSAPTLVGGNGSAGSTNVSILPYVTAAPFNGGYGGELATYGAGGIRPLTSSEYATTITSGSTTFDNVAVSGAIAGINASTQVNALKVNNNSPISGTGTLTVFSGAVLLNDSDASISVSTLNFGSAEGVFFSNRAPSTGYYTANVSSAITGTGGVTVATSAQFTGTNSFSGGLNLTQGQLLYSQDASLGLTSNTVNLAGGNLVYSGSTPSVMSRDIIVSQPSFVGSYNENTLTLSGAISGNGRLSLGSFTELTNPANSFTGGVDGSFRAGSDAVFGAATNPVSGELRATASFTLAHPFAGSVDANGFNVTIANLQPNQYIRSAGEGTVTVTSTGPIGTLQASRGTLVVPSAGIAAGNDNLFFDGGTLRLTGGDLTTNRTLYVFAFQGNQARYEAAIDTNGQSATFNGEIQSGAGNTNNVVVTKIGAGTLTIAPAAGLRNNLATVNINGGFLALGPANVAANGSAINFAGGGILATGSITIPQTLTANLGGATIDTNGFNVAVGGQLGGPGGLTKSGAGDLTFNGPASYTGATTVSQGRLILGSSNVSTGFFVASGATLRIDGGSVNVGLGSIQPQAGGAVEYNNAMVNGGFIRGPGTHTILGGTAFNGSTLQNGTSLAIPAPTTFVNFTAAGALAVNSGATLTWDAGTLAPSGTMNVAGTAHVAAWSSSGITTVQSGGAINNTDTNLVLGGGSRTTINNGGSLNMATGTTLEVNGALVTNNGTITGTTNANFGSLVRGNGTFGTVNTNDGGRFSPGASPGTANTSAANWNAGGTYVWEINSLATNGGTAGGSVGWDLWNTGTTTVSPGFVIEVTSLTNTNANGPLAGWNPLVSDSWLLATSTNGAFTQATADQITLAIVPFTNFNPLAGGTFALVGNGAQLFLTFTPVPEPATVMLVCLPTALYALRRRGRNVH